VVLDISLQHWIDFSPIPVGQPIRELGCADGSRRAYYKEFVKVVSAADVVIEVLDARDPLGSRCLGVERFVRQAGSDKKVILLLNKIGAPPAEHPVLGLSRTLRRD
jgi:hypothetical protein